VSRPTHRIEFPLLGHLGQVAAVLLQRGVLGLGVGGVDPLAAPHRLEGPAEALRRYAVAHQDLGHEALPVRHKCSQQMLHPHELVLPDVRGGDGSLYHQPAAVGEVELLGVGEAEGLGLSLHPTPNLLPESLSVDAQLLEYLSGQTPRLLYHGKEQVFRLGRLMAVLSQQLLSALQDLLGLLREAFNWYHPSISRRLALPQPVDWTLMPPGRPIGMPPTPSIRHDQCPKGSTAGRPTLTMTLSALVIL